MTHKHSSNTCPGCNTKITCKCPQGAQNETRDYCAKCNALVQEDAAAGATSAAGVAGFAGSLFGGSMPRRQRKAVQGIPVIRYSNKLHARTKRKPKLSESAPGSFAAFLQESVTDNEKGFDSADVISKLARNAEVSDDLDGDELAVFGMEDSEGGITKVYVPAEQGEEFEKALGDALRHTTENGETEIAALLFDLKDKFKIVDVKWPTVQEDEEEKSADPAAAGAPPAPVPGDPAAAAGPGASPAADGMPPADGAMAPDGVDPMAGGDLGAAAPGADVAPGAGDQGDILKQIVNMLMADAEARKAESAAKTAEANAKEAESAAKIAAIKIQGEESVLDAEAHFKAKKDEKKESDRIKMLAKFRQETQMSAPSQPQGEVKPVGAAPASTSPASPQMPAAGGSRDEEEEQLTHARRFLLGLINRG